MQISATDKPAPPAHTTWRLVVSVIAAVLAAGVLSRVFPVDLVEIHVRWAPEVTEAQRVELERQFQLRDRQQTDRTTWSYRLANPSTTNIRALVRGQQVEDTDGLDRNTYRPASELPSIQRHRTSIVFTSSAIFGSIVFGVFPVLPVILTAASRRAALLGPAMWSDVAAAMLPNAGVATRRPHNPQATVAVLLAGIVISAAMASWAGASVWSSVGALAVVYAGGYLVGSLLVARTEELSFAIIRTVAGLMLTSVGFLLSLVLSLPWFVVPAALLIVTLVVRRESAFEWPHEPVRIRWDGVVAAVLVAVLMSPIAIAFFRMAPGPFPPVFYNVDTAYGLEKVHALVATHSFPPPSLSNLGVARTYHYGITRWQR